MTNPLIYIARTLPPAALASITAAGLRYRMWPSETQPIPRETLLQEVAEAEGLVSLISERVDRELLAAAPRLQVVANVAVGYDNIDLAALNERNVLLTNTPDVLTETTADLGWALLMAAARRVVEGHKLIEADQWRHWSIEFMVGQDISGARLGVVGAGRIGAAVLRRGRGFAMELAYHNRQPNPALESETGARYQTLDELLRESDFVVVTVPLTNETPNMFGAAQFALMKPSSVFVNIARGAVVDEAALVEALKNGRPWAAGLDVFVNEPIRAEHPLVGLPNVVVAPHMASASVRNRLRMASLAVENAVAVLSGKPALTPVNA